MSKLETLVDNLNAALLVATAAAFPALSKKFEGPALLMGNRAVFTESEQPAAPDDKVGLHVFHVVQSARFTPPVPAPGGREKRQRQLTTVALIGYSTERLAYDRLTDAVARFGKVALVRAELTPAGVRKLLGLQKDATASNAGDGRYLFALLYDADTTAGGLVC